MKAKKTSAKAMKAPKAMSKSKPAEPKRSAANKAGRTTVAKPAPAAKKTAPPKAVKKSVVGKVKVPNKSQPPAKSAAVATSPAKPATKAAAAPAPVKPVPRPAAAKPRARTPGAPMSEEDIRAMSDDDYMNESQLEFFRLRLLQMRQEVLQRELDVKERLHEREVFADPADRATAEEEHWLDLRLRERESLLLKKIDEALRRIEGREYGYCEKTGDPIGIPRLLARPTATVSVDVKGQDERVEAQYRDR